MTVQYKGYVIRPNSRELPDGKWLPGGGREADGPPVRVQLLLAGLNGAAEGKRFNTRTALGQPYRFERLPAGSYRLIGAAAGQRLWDLTFSVEDGREVVLDLGTDNSSAPTIALSR